MNLYEILNLDRNASMEEIEKAYKRLARKYHPDLNPGDSLIEEKFKNILFAYRILSNLENKEKYDKYGEVKFVDDESIKFDSLKSKTNKKFDISKLLSDEDLSENFFESSNKDKHIKSVSPKGNIIHHSIEIDFYEAFQGIGKEVQIEIPKICNNCGGKGHIQNIVDIKKFCEICRGSGRILVNEKLKVKIPPGVDNSSMIKVEKKEKNDFIEDIYVFTKVIPHPFFERKGDNLYCEAPITIVEAVLGSIIEVPTPEEMYTLRIPPGTETGSVFKIVGYGFPRLKGKGRGDLYVKVLIAIPKDVSKEGKELLLDFSKINPYDPREKIRIYSIKVKPENIKG